MVWGRPMSFREDLEAKVAELREAGREREEHYLAFYQYGPLEDRLPGDELLLAQHDRFMGALGDLADSLETFGDLDVVPFEDMALKLGGLELGFAALAEHGTVYSQLTMAISEMTDVAQLVVGGEWEGDAAKAFYRHFTKPFLEDAGPLWQAYTQELNLAVGALRNTVETTQEDILAIIDATIRALKGEQMDLSDFFNCVSAISTVAGFVVAPEIVGGISVASGFGSAFMTVRDQEPEEQEWRIEVPEANLLQNDPQVIVNSAWDQKVRLENITADNDADHARALEQDLRGEDAFDHPKLSLERPDIADDPTAFGDSEIPHDPPGGGDEYALVASLVHLYRAGNYTMQIVAALIDAARESLEECQLPFWLSRYLPRTVQRFDLARNHLGRYLLSFASDHVRDSAANLVVIARTYQLTDEEEAERTRLIQIEDTPQGFPF